MEEIALQAVKAAAYYLALIVLLRFAGKRLAGQTTTFDLIVLTTLGVVLQTTALEKGTVNALVFVGTVFAMHKLVAVCCATSDTFGIGYGVSLEFWCETEESSRRP